MRLDVHKLAELLQQAEAEHIKVEQDSGEPDDNWAQWYAEYVLRELEDDVQDEPAYRTGRPKADNGKK